MSIRRTDYLFVGVKLDYEEEQQNHDGKAFDFYEPYIDGKNEIDCIFDGCNGEYIFLGKIVRQAYEEDGETLGVVQVDTFELGNEKIAIRTKLYNEFKQFFSIGIWVITNWS